MKIIQRIKQVPNYGWIFGISFFALQYGMYRLADFLSGLIGTKANAWCPKIEAIDNLFTVVPIFSIVYLLFSYLFWISGPIVVSLTKKSNFINYIIGLLSAYIVGFLIFTFFQSYMDRVSEGLMEMTNGNGFLDWVMRLIYSADGDQFAYNMFPSYHCLISLYCYLGIRKQPEISKGYKIFAICMVILICLSTLYTKQHYFIDVIGGLTVSLVCYVVVKRINPGKKMLSRSRR